MLVLAVHDARFVWMQFQTTLRQPLGDWRLEQTELASQSCSEQLHHRSTARIAGRETASPAIRRARNARTGWLITVRSLSLAACPDLGAPVCHPSAGAGPSASAPRTAGSTAR